LVGGDIVVSPWNVYGTWTDSTRMNPYIPIVAINTGNVVAEQFELTCERMQISYGYCKVQLDLSRLRTAITTTGTFNLGSYIKATYNTSSGYGKVIVWIDNSAKVAWNVNMDIRIGIKYNFGSCSVTYPPTTNTEYADFTSMTEAMGWTSEDLTNMAERTYSRYYLNTPSS